ncbi:VOC family protein [Mesorhizobium sp. M0478]|uniref:VOC family protein n=1 Tax=Mesorhizobium sp. M0478 TaxID=2956947 RepID=UPI00333A68B2
MAKKVVSKRTAKRDFGLRLKLAFVETSEGRRLEQFYGELLRLPIRRRFGEDWIEYDGGAANVAVHQVAEEPSNEPRIYLSFEVADIDALWKHLATNGVRVSPIRSRTRGRFFVCQDPAGVRLHFITFEEGWRADTDY